MGAIMAYVMFFDPLPIWVKWWFWSLLVLPLCLAVAVVYKSVRCREMSQVPREATLLFVTIVVGMILTAAALAGLAAIMG